MKSTEERFSIRQSWLLRIYLIWLGSMTVSMGFLIGFQDQIDDTFEWLENLLVTLFFAPFVLFGWALVEVGIFLIRHRSSPNRPRIWRSITVLLTSPIAAVVYVIFMFVVLASFASCTYTG